jgi:hypothetical protein
MTPVGKSGLAEVILAYSNSGFLSWWDLRKPLKQDETGLH